MIYSAASILVSFSKEDFWVTSYFKSQISSCSCFTKQLSTTRQGSPLKKKQVEISHQYFGILVTQLLLKTGLKYNNVTYKRHWVPETMEPVARRRNQKTSRFWLVKTWF